MKNRDLAEMFCKTRGYGKRSIGNTHYDNGQFYSYNEVIACYGYVVNKEYIETLSEDGTSKAGFVEDNQLFITDNRYSNTTARHISLIKQSTDDYNLVAGSISSFLNNPSLAYTRCVDAIDLYEHKRFKARLEWSKSRWSDLSDMYRNTKNIIERAATLFTIKYPNARMVE